MLNYKVSQNWHIIRWENRKSFIENIFWKKNSNTALIIVNFNNFKNIKYLIDYIGNLDLDIVIIENSTKDEEIIKLKEFVTSKKQDITIIKSVNDIGSAWWYALWMEYVIDCNYDYFYIVEDDVIFLEDDTVKELLKSKSDDTLTFINNGKNVWDSRNQKDKWRSWWVHVAWYPTSFLKKIWIIDPRYFFRWEDIEWWYKIKKWLEHFGYKVKILDKNYLHPYLKSVNKSYAFVYFSIRNQLFSLKKNWKDFKWILFTIFLYICSWLSKVVSEFNIELIKSILFWIKDFVKMDYSFETNLYNVWSCVNPTKKIWEDFNMSQHKNILSNCYGNKIIMQITWYNDEMMPKYSKNIASIFYWIIISSNSTVFYFLTLLSRNIINIEKIWLENEEFTMTYRNKSIMWYILSLIIFIPVLCISIFIYVIVILAIVWNLVFVKSYSQK